MARSNRVGCRVTFVSMVFACLLSTSSMCVSQDSVSFDLRLELENGIVAADAWVQAYADNIPQKVKVASELYSIESLRVGSSLRITCLKNGYNPINLNLQVDWRDPRKKLTVFFTPASSSGGLDLLREVCEFEEKLRLNGAWVKSKQSIDEQKLDMLARSLASGTGSGKLVLEHTIGSVSRTKLNEIAIAFEQRDRVVAVGDSFASRGSMFLRSSGGHAAYRSSSTKGVGHSPIGDGPSTGEVLEYPELLDLDTPRIGDGGQNVAFLVAGSKIVPGSDFRSSVLAADLLKNRIDESIAQRGVFRSVDGEVVAALSDAFLLRFLYLRSDGSWRSSSSVSLGHAIDSWAYTSDKKRFAASSGIYFDGVVSIVDVEDGHRISTFSTEGGVSDLVFDKMGTNVFVCSRLNEMVYKYDVVSGEYTATYPVKDLVGSISWSADGDALLVPVHSGEMVQIRFDQQK